MDHRPREFDELIVGGGPPVRAEPITLPPTQPASRRRIRRFGRSFHVMLFLVTCLSTFFAGASGWSPVDSLFRCWTSASLMPIRGLILMHWQDGLTYMACLLAILLVHEMGHFLATVRYHIPATLPFFLPLPISPIGTLGAVIGMDGLRANRREMFDIGLAGPLAGLVIAVPVMWIGVQRLDLTVNTASVFRLDLPLAVRWIMEWVGPPGFRGNFYVGHSQLNPFFMAGWVGFLITGLNMMPVSQLDGGHVIYTLFGRRAHWIARLFMVSAIVYILLMGVYGLFVMLLLVMLIGTDHPPTRDDTVPLGWFRTLLGLASLSIPILCFPPRVIIV